MDRDLMEILFLSMQINILALIISCLLGFPFGAALAILRFPARNIVLAIINALMALPPVVVGLLVYLYLSRSGPLGWLGLLYTPSAMIFAQIILVTPIIAALSCQIIEDLHSDYKQYFSSLVLSPQKAIGAYLYDARYSLITVVLAGFGRRTDVFGLRPDLLPHAPHTRMT